MKQELKDKWLAALRSGEYQQGHSQLRSNDDCFCCLGVLCDVYDPTLWAEPNQSNARRYNFPNTNSNSGITPSVFELDIGLRIRVVDLEEPEQTCNIADNLISMNDSGDYDFNQIADYIEANLPATE